MGGDVSSSTSTASLPLRSLLCRLQRDRERIKLLSRKHQHSRTRSARAALQDDDYYYYIIIIERRDIQTEDVYLTGRQLVFCMCVMSTGDEEDSVHQHKSNIYTHTSIFLRSLRIWSDDVTIEIPSSSLSRSADARRSDKTLETMCSSESLGRETSFGYLGYLVYRGFWGYAVWENALLSS